MLPGSVPSDDEIRQLASRILERPEYAAWRPDQALRQLIEWLSSLWVTNQPLFWLITGISVLLLVLIVVHLVWTIRFGMATRPPATLPAPAANASRFADEARRLAEQGRFLDAARALQLGTIEILVRKGHVRLGRGDANATFRRRVREAPLGDGLREELVALIARLERSLFRDRDEDETLYRSWQHAYAQVDAS